MKGRLVLFKGVYNTLDLKTEALRLEFLKLGYQVMMFDVKNMQQSLGELAAFCREKVTAVIAFNNLGFNMELEQGKIVWDQLAIPFINILVDHPFHYHDSLLHPPKRSIVLCSDRKHVEYIHRFYPDIAAIDFMPIAGREVEKERHVEWEKRPIDVLYAGGLSKFLVQALEPNMEKYNEFDAKNMCDVVLKELVETPELTTESAIENYLIKSGCQVPDERLREIITDFRILDSYAVSHYREKSVRSLVEAGVDVHIYGAGWEQCEWIGNEHAHYHKRCSMEKILEIMLNSKIVLNTMTWFKDGQHERVANGSLAGALVVSEENPFMEESYKDGKEMCLFRLEEIDKVPDIVKNILKYPALGAEIAERGYEKSIRQNTWRNRAEYIEREILKMLLDGEE